jgi:hypothetical protein
MVLTFMYCIVLWCKYIAPYRIVPYNIILYTVLPDNGIALHCTVTVSRYTLLMYTVSHCTHLIDSVFEPFEHSGYETVCNHQASCWARSDNPKVREKERERERERECERESVCVRERERVCERERKR